MKFFISIIAICLVLIVGGSGCGDDNATSSETGGSGAAAKTDDASTANADSDESEDSSTSTPVVGEYESEGPFSAIAGQTGNKKPKFTPSGQPAPKEVVTRELEVGSGTAAKRGDKASVYFAGAVHGTDKVTLYGWAPSAPSVVELGTGLYGKTWEKTIEGMKVGGIRQVILPSSEFAEGKPVDYVIVMTDLEAKKPK
jgi:FKBP-type peptidyl-prolyl cis-trans isomerase